VEIRAMESAEVEACVEVFGRALDGMRAAAGLTPGGAGRLGGGVAHLLSTDPGGTFVAIVAGEAPEGTPSSIGETTRFPRTPSPGPLRGGDDVAGSRRRRAARSCG
jgi:hypothetical protein